ncbi:MAG: hypothetical protein ACE5SW_10650 [Nitrososphaeraceae archaeon]
MTNITIVPAFITLIVAAGLLTLSPSMIWNAQAETYDDNHYQSDNSYSYDQKEPKVSHLNIQKINCGNSNVNVNGVDVNGIPQDNTDIEAANEGGPGAANTETGTGLVDRINFDRNLVNVCVNANGNEQTRANAGPQPPQIPLFTCGEGSNLGAGAIVTDEELCDAATPAEQCPEGTDLEGVWVVDADAEGACDVEAGGTVTASTYENAGNLDSATPFTSTANCDAGDVATGGGYTVTGNPAAISNHKSAGEGWTVTATVTGSGPSLQAFVTCLNNPLSPPP